MGNPQNRNVRAIGEQPKASTEPKTTEPNVAGLRRDEIPGTPGSAAPTSDDADSVTFRRDDPHLLDHLRATIAELEALAAPEGPPEPRQWQAEPEWSGWAMRSTPRGFEWCRVLLRHDDVEANQVGVRHAPDNRGIVIAKIENDMRSDRMSDRRGWVRNTITNASTERAQ